jgi:hypothetical protein
MTQGGDEGITQSWFHVVKEGRERLLCPAIDCHDGHVFLHLPNKGTNREVSPQEFGTILTDSGKLERRTERHRAEASKYQPPRT